MKTPAYVSAQQTERIDCNCAMVVCNGGLRGADVHSGKICRPAPLLCVLTALSTPRTASALQTVLQLPFFQAVCTGLSAQFATLPVRDSRGIRNGIKKET